MKVYYFNDEKETITVKVMDDTWDHTYATDNSKNYRRLAPLECHVFDVQFPDGHMLFVKKWPGVVMLSSLDPAALTQPDPRRPKKDGE